MMENFTHTRLPENGTPPALAAARLNIMIDHALSHAQHATPKPAGATILAFRRHGWMGLASVGLAAAVLLAVMPGTFNRLTGHSTIIAGGLGQTASNPDALDDVSDMLTLNSLDSLSPDDNTGI